MTTKNTTNTAEQKLRELVARIERHQVALELTDKQFVARYIRHLSSTRTWRQRLVNGDFREMKLSKWTEKLQRMVAEIDGGTVVEDYFDDLPIAQAVREVYNILQGQTSDRRCAVVIGKTGIGKSVIAKKIVAENPRETGFVECNENCTTPFQLVRAFSRAVGAPEKHGASTQTEALLEFLKARPMTIFVDEGHEGGVGVFKLVKSLINQTKAKFLLFCYPTKWSRLISGSDDAYSEAQQLLGRTIKPVIDHWSDGVHRADVAAYLRAAVPSLNGESESLAAAIVEDVRTHGNFRILADAIDDARLIADEAGNEITPGLIREQIKALIPARK